MNAGLVTVSYIGASILFILSLGGLSHQEKARRGNWYGIAGMVIAIAIGSFPSFCRWGFTPFLKEKLEK